MTIYLWGFAMLAIAVFLAWLVATHRLLMPLLFECGLAILAFGILVNGICLVSDDAPSLRAWALAGVGAALMLVSYFRESRRKHHLGPIGRRIMRGPR